MTPDQAVRSAQGEDRSAFQAVSGWAGLDFGVAKATEGTSWTDPTFAANWANLAKAGIPRGAYHYLHPALDPVAQAQHFLSTVKAHGLRDGDMLIADVEILSGADGFSWLSPASARRSHLLDATPEGVPFLRPGVDQPELLGRLTTAVGSAAQALCTEVARVLPHNPVIIYTNLAVGAELGACTGFPLWIAYPASSAPASVAPWKSWRLWQWSFGGGEGGGDRDAFAGTAAQLHAWIASYLPKPPAPPPPKPPVPVPPAKITETDMPMLLNGKDAVTPLLVPANMTKLLLVATDRQQKLPAAKLDVGFQSPWQQEDVTVSWDSGVVEVALAAGATMGRVVRLDAGNVNIAYGWA